MLEKFLETVAFINSIFYGEYWYIAWGCIVLLFLPFIIKELPKFVKSIKEAKKRCGK